jgi:glycosyltransferase involved in cell wall biosynthesis
MRVVILADTFPPQRTSGAVQLRDLAREFAEQGHEPTVIVPSGEIDVAWKIETAMRVTILRCRTPGTKDIGYVRRTINEMRLPYTLLRALRESKLTRAPWGGIIWYSPSIFLGPIVRVLRRESGCRSYLILRDIFPEWAVDMGLMGRGLAYQFFKLVERHQYSAADTIGLQTKANLPYMSDWAKQPGRKLEVLQNWLSEGQNTGCRIRIEQTKLAGRKIFVYAGNMGVAQGIGIFIELAARMRMREDVGFLFVGRGRDAAQFVETADAQEFGNLLYNDEIEPDEIPGLLAQCHVGIVSLDPRHTTHNIPGKFLTYMRAGLPVLARTNPGNDLEKLINDERVGRVCIGGDVITLQRLVDELIANPVEFHAMCGRGQGLWKRLFSSATAVKQIVAALSHTPEV